MQLEFFGENFDPVKCNKTCDNCRSGKVAERRNVTDVAKVILRLLGEMQIQRKQGVTMTQLAEIYRGSKSKSATKFLNLSRLTGYGSGSTFKKHEIDRITHAMIFERLLTETGVETNNGFVADYVNLGDHAHALLNGQRLFFVDFPNSGTRGRGNKKNSSTSKRKTNKVASKKTPKKPENSKHSVSGATSDTSLRGGLQFSDVVGALDQAEDDEMTDGSGDDINEVAPAILPHEYHSQLVAKIKTLTQHWADEEQFSGKSVFCKSTALNCSLTVQILM